MSKLVLNNVSRQLVCKENTVKDVKIVCIDVLVCCNLVTVSQRFDQTVATRPYVSESKSAYTVWRNLALAAATKLNYSSTQANKQNNGTRGTTI